MNYFTFEITKKFGKTNYTTGWWVSYPGGNYSRKSLKKIRREVEELYDNKDKPEESPEADEPTSRITESLKSRWQVLAGIKR